MSRPIDLNSDKIRCARQSYLRDWLKTTHSEDEDYLYHASQRIIRLYAACGLEAPQILPCLGPMQQLLFPAIVEIMLRQGEEASRASNFERQGMDTPIIRREWDRLWTEAFSYLDWDLSEGPYAAYEGLGAPIDQAITKHINRTIRFKGKAKADQELGMDCYETVAKTIQSEIYRTSSLLKNCTMFAGIECANLWKDFLYRLQPDARDALILTPATRSQNRPFDAKGPVPEAWASIRDWSDLASLDFAHEHLSCKQTDAVLEEIAFWKHLGNAATAYLFCEHACFIFLKPLELHIDERGRRHHARRPAVDFLDGTGFFYWHGVEVHEDIILHPEQISLRSIEEERNIEVRRIMIDIFGLENFIRGGFSQVRQEDAYGKLHIKRLPDDEPIAIVEVVNSTPEPDGTYKRYFLRVPPTTTTAKEGVAWSFGMREQDYNPRIET